ncbi:MAG TPA: hypothetical protein PLE90_00115 [Dysgonamonadaceae bacterium]|jgi:membrane-associated phospholipid phosphatase|nr:hypothetical protein [Dysgonamonadaceae bacterium]
MKLLAHIISAIFQPLLMPVYNVLLLFIYTDQFRVTYADHFLEILLPVFVFSFAIPSLSILLMYRMRIISNISLDIRHERFIPYIFTLISYGFMIYFYQKMGMPFWFIMLNVASVIVMALAIVVTFWWKISAHMFGVGGLMGGVMAVSHYVEHVTPHYLIMALFLISGLVGSSRLLLKKHTPAQVYTGFLLGFTVSFICVRLGA